VRLVRGADIGKHAGERVAMIGWLVTGKIVTTKDDEPMEFVSFEDTTALYETVFFPEAYTRFCRMLTTARPYLLRGKVEEEFGVPSLQVEKVEFLRRSRPAGAKASVSPAASGPRGAAVPAAARPGSSRPSPSGRSA